MVTKIRNIVLFAAAALIFVSLMVTQVLYRTGVPLPEWLQVGKEQSSLEGRTYQWLPDLTVDAVMDGTFQQHFDKWAADHVPVKDSLLLTNAAVQRAFISTSATVLGYDIYPTFFSSGRLYIPSQHAVTYLPERSSEYRTENLTTFAQGVADVAAQFPNKRFVIYVVGGYETPAVNPAYDLVTNAATSKEAYEIVSAAATADNVSVLTSQYDSVDEYYADFFRTDHHWNILGTAKAYNQIAETLGLNPLTDLSTTPMEGYAYSGATARWGLIDVTESVFTLDHDLSGENLYNLDGSLIRNAADLNCFYSIQDPQLKKTAFYDVYYDTDSEAVISGSGTGKALIISNSYGGSIRNFIAEQYATTNRFLDLHPYGSGESISARIEETSADDIIFIANAGDYIQLAANRATYLR